MITVAISVYAHGATAWHGSESYADWYENQGTDPDIPEAAGAPTTRTRGMLDTPTDSSRDP